MYQVLFSPPTHEPGNEASAREDRESSFHRCGGPVRLVQGCLCAGVTGNPIRAYTDPGGSDPLAESIRRIGFASGSDPPPDQFYQRIRSFAAKTIRLWCKCSVKKITSCQDDVRFLNTSRTFYIIQSFGTHGYRLPDDL